MHPWISLGGSSYNIFNTGTLTADTWNHVVLTRTYNVQWELFLNGASLGTYNAQGLTNDFSSSTVYYFGANLYSSLYYYDGQIDQVRIFSSALSPTQVTSLYDEVYCNTVSKLDIFNDNSCTALYEFEDDAKSTESSGNDATEVGTVAYGGGQYKKGIIFNGSSNGVNLPDILPANSTADSTFTCWFNTSDTSGTQQTIVNAWNGSTTANNGGYALFKDLGNVLRLGNYYLNSTASGFDGSTNVGDGKWHFVAIVFDYSAGSLTLYLDGSIELKPDGNPLQITGLTPGTVNPFNGGAELGYQLPPGSGIRYFPGTIDQVRIFNKALSETERLQVYTE